MVWNTTGITVHHAFTCSSWSIMFSILKLVNREIFEEFSLNRNEQRAQIHQTNKHGTSGATVLTLSSGSGCSDPPSSLAESPA